MDDLNDMARAINHFTTYLASVIRRERMAQAPAGLFDIEPAPKPELVLEEDDDEPLKPRKPREDIGGRHHTWKNYEDDHLRQLYGLGIRDYKEIAAAMERQFSIRVTPGAAERRLRTIGIIRSKYNNQ